MQYYKQGHSATQAARLAGYDAKTEQGFAAIGSKNLHKLAQHIVQAEERIACDDIASVQEINAFWTQIMRNPNEALRDRIKASELRAKASGAFLDKGEAVEDAVFSVQIEVVE